MKIEEILIEPATLALPATCRIPDEIHGWVIFAHGSGSSRLSPRNRQVAESLSRKGLATVLLDLLSESESRDRSQVFDIEKLASRLTRTTRWLDRQGFLQGHRVGYFGASTGAAAALRSAVELGARIGAVVSRGGRPDLAMPQLPQVNCPVLLLVGGNDEVVLDLNREALKQLPDGTLSVIPYATHLFEEPGKLDEVAKQACEFFLSHLEPSGWLPMARAA